MVARDSPFCSFAEMPVNIDTPSTRAVGVDDLVEVRRPVVGVGQVEELVLRALDRGGQQLGQVVGVPLQRDLAALRVLVQGLERVTADEVVVELHERAVTELPRVGVVVLDVVGDEAAGDGVGRLVAVGAEPLAVGTQFLAGVDGRQRRGDPARTRGCWSSRRASPRAPCRTPGRPRGWPRGSGRSSRRGPRSPGPARRPCRAAACARSPRRSFMVLIRKNFSCSSVPPLSFSMIGQALGPWIWKRHRSRVTALPYGREDDRGRCGSRRRSRRSGP